MMNEKINVILGNQWTRISCDEIKFKIALERGLLDENEEEKKEAYAVIRKLSWAMNPKNWDEPEIEVKLGEAIREFYYLSSQYRKVRKMSKDGKAVVEGEDY